MGKKIEKEKKMTGQIKKTPAKNTQKHLVTYKKKAWY